MRAIIIGAGIGGLTAALTLHRQRWDVEVYEAVDEIQPLGVGINLLPHGSQALHELGLGAALSATGFRTRAIEYRTKYGHVITSDLRGTEAGFAYPQYSIHRGSLQFLLLEAVIERLGGDHIHPGNSMESFEQDGDGVTARFSSGATTRGDVLIGADGFHSTVRTRLHPEEGPAHFEGTALWRTRPLRRRAHDVYRRNPRPEIRVLSDLGRSQGARPLPAQLGGRDPQGPAPHGE